jgi:hypothetical protein
MYCIFKVIQNMMNKVEDETIRPLPRPTTNSELDFLMNSMSDETFLDLIREKIEFLIDEGYKYSEQLKIINRDSGRNISYSTYTRFVKMYVLEDPQNLFQMREFYKYYSGYAPVGQAPQPQMQQPQVIIREEAPKKEEIEKPREEFKNEPPKDEGEDDLRKRLMEARKKSKGKAKKVEEEPKKKTVVEPLKKPDVKVETRGPLYKHEAMPDKNELY